MKLTFIEDLFCRNKENFDERVYLQDGKVEFDVGDSDQIKEKYNKNKHSLGKDKDFQFDKDVKDQSKKKARIEGITKISAHIYRFKGCISEFFEPYLQGYSETEELKITEALDQAFSNDELEEGEYPFYSSALVMFAEIKKSIAR